MIRRIRPCNDFRKWLALGVMLSIGMLADPSLEAGEKAVTVTAEAGSAYVWRGQILSQDPVIQPELTLTAGPFSLDVWSSFQLTDYYGSSGELGEVDVTVQFEGEFGAVAYEAGVSHFHYRTPEPGETAELFFQASVPMTITPWVGLHWDFVAADGLYVDFGLTWEREISQRQALQVTVSSGWGNPAFNAYSYDVQAGAWNDGAVLLSYSLSGEATTGWLFAGASWLWDSAIEPNAIEFYGDSEKFYAGLGIEF